MDQLLKAAEVLMGDPGRVTAEDRYAAEQVFLQFRNSQNPFNLSRDILESCQNPSLLYEATVAIRTAVIRDYSVLPEADVEALSAYLLNYIMTHQNSPAFVRETLIQVICIMLKRSAIKDEQRLGKILDEVERFITQKDVVVQSIGCSMILCLYQEFAITVKSADIGLPWEQHYATKMVFERKCLRRVFDFVCKLLTEFANLDQPITQELRVILGKLITIAENTLSWSFMSVTLPRGFLHAFEHGMAPSFKPPGTWKDVFAPDSKLVELFFKLYWKLRDDWEISHHLMNCLIQLASSTGPCFTETDLRILYVSQYMNCLIEFLKSAKIKEVEAQGLSTIFRRLVMFLPMGWVTKISETLFVEYVRHFIQLTCDFGQQAAAEINVDPEEQMFTEAYDQMLAALSSMLDPSSQADGESYILQQKAFLVFQGWMISHLSPPNGSRIVLENSEVTDPVPDREAFSDQLSAVGLCAQQEPSLAFPVLNDVIEDRIAALNKLLHQGVNAGLNTSTNVAEFDAVYEDLHWTLLTASSMMVSQFTEKMVNIPEKVMRYSFKMSRDKDQAKNLALVNPLTLSEVTDREETDPVIRLTGNVFRLCQMECQAMKEGIEHLLSPEVSCSLMWFLKNFSSAYLYHQEPEEPVYNYAVKGRTPKDKAYFEELMSISISTCFGNFTESANAIYEFILSYVEMTLSRRGCEQALVNDAVDVLIATFSKRKTSCRMVSSFMYSKFVELLHSSNLVKTSPDAQRGLAQALTIAISGVLEEEQEPVLRFVVEPLVLRLQAIVTDPNFSKNSENENTKAQVISLLDQFIGMAEGVKRQSAKGLFYWLGGMTPYYIKIIEVYKNYPNVIEYVLQLYLQCSESIVYYLRVEESSALVQGTVEILKTYSQCNVGKRALARDSEDEQMRDLQVLLELLISLNNNVFNLTYDNTSRKESDDNTEEKTANAVLYGLSLVIPLMNVELLKIPTLGKTYYQLIYCIAECYIVQMVQSEPHIKKDIYSSVELGLTHFGSDIGMICFDIVRFITYHHLCTNNESGKQDVLPFLKVILDVALSGRMNSDLNGTASEALYDLIRLFPAEYDSLVHTLINSQESEMKKQRLHSAFNHLMDGVEFTKDRNIKKKFVEKCECFISSVQLFLLVK